MARLQVLHLPGTNPDGTDRFALVLDQVSNANDQFPRLSKLAAGIDPAAEPSATSVVLAGPVDRTFTSPLEAFAQACGAQGALVAEETIEVL